jgi:thiosulfate/3-mercaptopyruvate sulfurtransferase
MFGLQQLLPTKDLPMSQRNLLIGGPYNIPQPQLKENVMRFRHNSRIVFILIAALMLITAPAMSGQRSDAAVESKMGTLVTAEWLAQHLVDPDLVVLDCTVRMVPKEGGGMGTVSGRADYDGGHIPSAGFADLMGNLSDLESPFDYALPTPERFCAVMGSLGVGDDSRVVLYDNFNSVWASRVWWMLRWVGFDRVALLDGGLRAWTAEEREMSTEPAKHKVKHLTPKPRPELIAYQDDVFAAIKDDSITLIDTMNEPHYRGEMAMYDRPGHIPTAKNVSALALFDKTGRFRPDDELGAMFDGDPKGQVITYCGGGIAASAVAYVMVRLGFTDVAVYTASLQEWAADPDLPLVVEKPKE